MYNPVGELFVKGERYDLLVVFGISGSSNLSFTVCKANDHQKGG